MLLVLASAFTGAIGTFLVYLAAGHAVASAAGFALSVAAVLSGGVATLVFIGPLLAVWSIWEIYVLGAPHDGKRLLFVIPQWQEFANLACRFRGLACCLLGAGAIRRNALPTMKQLLICERSVG